MATVAKKVKVEPLPDGRGSFQTNRIKIKTEDGETIYIKKEKEDNIASVIDTADYETVEVKTEKTDDTLLRSALAGPPKPLRRGKQYLQFIEKVSGPGKKRNADYDVTSSSEEEEEGEEEMKKKEQQSKTESERSQQIIEKLMQMQKSEVGKSKNDSGRKDNDDPTNSTKIKIVFDPSGKLKEWRIDKDKDKDSSLQPTNLGKILMFANMMKNSSSNDPKLKRKEDPEEQKSTANLDMIKSIAQQQFKRKKVGVEDFIVGPDFHSFKCKICSKEFLNRTGLTTHMKLHHLSLSGMPGSSLFDPNMGKTEASPPNVAKNVAAALSAISASYTPTRQVTATVSKPSPEVFVHPTKSAVIVKESLGSENSLPEVISPPKKTTNPEILFLPTKKTASGQQIVQLPTKTSTTVMHGQASPVSSILSSMIKNEPPPMKHVIKTEPSPSGSSTNVRPVTMVATNDMTNVTPGNVISKASSSKFTPITDKMFHCEICPKMYNTADMLAQHVLAHNRERPFMCGLCDNRYMLHNDLEAHLLTHTDPDEQTTVLFTCSHCNEEYDTDRQLQEHLKIHSDVETETVYECGMCGTELNSQTELQIHMKRHIKNAFEPCKCGICKASFHRVEALKNHIAREHFPQTEYMCKYCKCRFMNKDALKRHMPVHEQGPDAKVMKFAHRWKCRYCIQRYEYKPDMITHMRLEHPQSRFFDCSFCETSFFTKEDLQAHVKTHSVVAHFL